VPQGDAVRLGPEIDDVALLEFVPLAGLDLAAVDVAEGDDVEAPALRPAATLGNDVDGLNLA
jgi:hypothetical protein